MTTGTSPFRPRLESTLRLAAALVAAALALPPAAAPESAPPAATTKAPAAAPAAAPTAAGAAEPAEETYYESVDVDVVNVEVVATDRAGRPVSGLTRDSFELYEDGKPVAVTNFFSSAEEAAAPIATSAATPVAAPAAPAPATARVPVEPPVKSPEQVLNFAVFVDNENLTATSRRPVLAALDQFFRKHVGVGDHVILASYDGGIKVTQPAASDAAALTAAVGKLMTGVSHGSAAIADNRRMQREATELDEAQFSGSQGPGIQSPLNAEIGRQLVEDQELGGNLEIQRGRVGLSALADFITSLAGLPGRKALLLVTGAFAVEPGEPLLNRIAEHANTNRVTVYVLGAVEAAGAGSVDAATKVSQDAFTSTDALTGALHSIADRTGGTTAANLLNPETFLEAVRQDVNTYYSLGFSPGHRHDGKIHKLAVKLKDRRGLSLRYRDTYEDRSGDQRAASETVSTLLLGVGENPLGVELSVEPQAARSAASSKTKSILTMVVHVPVGKLVLIPQEHFHEGKLTLFVATRDARGRMSSLRRLAAPVHVANDKLMASLGQSVAFRVQVDVRPGEQTVAVGVRDELGHVDSTASAALGAVQTANAAPAPAVRPPGR